MDVAVDDPGRVEGAVDARELVVAGVGERRAPQIAGLGVDDGQLAHAVLGGQTAQPGQPLLAQPLPRVGHVGVEDQLEQLRMARQLGEQTLALVVAPEHLVGVADHARPAELADPVDHLRGLRAHQRQVAAVDHQVGRAGAQVRDDRLERGQVPVDVGDDGDAAQSLHQPWTISPSRSWRGPKARICRPLDPASNWRVTAGSTRIASSGSSSTMSSSSLTRPLPATTT